MINWSDYFYYDETSPSCLSWKVNVYTGKSYGKIQVHKDSVAGCSTHHAGYWVTKLQQKRYATHKIIWELHNGKIPEDMIVDHMNGDKKDNRIINLRLVTWSMNTRNNKKNGRNTSGVTGVSLKTCIKNNGKPYTYWVAQWRDLNSKVKSKSYSTNKYGYDEAFRLACEWREKMILELNAQGAGYTERHGK